MITIPISQMEEEEEKFLDDEVSLSEKGFMALENLEGLKDTKFVPEVLEPYLKELFNDMLWRDSENDKSNDGLLSRYTFKEVSKLKMFYIRYSSHNSLA